MKIGILETGLVTDKTIYKKYGRYSDMFIKLLSSIDSEVTYSVYNILEYQFPKTVDECDCWLITGSKHSVLDDRIWVHELADFIRRCYNQHIKMIGICFGHQLIAKALGGKVEVGEWGIGADCYELTANLPYIQSDISAVNMATYHQDHVVQPPPNFEVLGKSNFCKNAILYSPDRALTTQAHPEMTLEYISLLCKRDNKKIDLDKNQELHSYQFAETMLAFLKANASV